MYTENYKTDEINQRWDKQMDMLPMFLGRKNQYCENDYTTKFNLQIQWNTYQITNGIFHRTRTKKIHSSYGNTKEPKRSQSSLEKEEWSWRNQPF